MPKKYTIKSGDTLYGISKKYNIPFDELLDNNTHIKNPSLVRIGDEINIPDLSVDNNKISNGNTGKYVVKRGDTMAKIANELGVSLNELLSNNSQIKNPSLIHIGDEINIPKKINNESVKNNNIESYVVKSGDSFGKISKRFGIPVDELINANSHIKNPSLIKIGDEINIPKKTKIYSDEKKHL